MRTTTSRRLADALSPIVAAAFAASVLVSGAAGCATGSMRPDSPASAQSPATVRDVGAEEMKESRGPTEDELRRRLLSLFSEGDVLGRLRGILNEPWDEDGAGYPEYTGGDAWAGDWEKNARDVENVTAPANKDWSKDGKQW